MNVPLLDLKAQYAGIKEDIIAATLEVYESQHFILGAKVEALEQAVAAYCNCPFAVGLSSGTDALLVSLMSLDIGPGDEVITTPYTFFATAGSVLRVGAKPVFVDIEEDTYNMDPKGIEDRITERTRALLPVHLYGQCCDMDRIRELARAYGLAVIEDGAQAIGAEYKGARAGSMGDAGCFSFFPSKNLGAFGDGGMVTTSSEALYNRLKQLRVHGSSLKYRHELVGGNFRLDALQAAVLLVKLPHLDRWSAARQANAQRYRDLFADAGLDRMIHLPGAKQSRHVYNQFVIRVRSGRDELKDFLRQSGIGTEVYYPIPMHLQPCLKGRSGAQGAFPKAEAAALTTLALPIYPELKEEQQAYVVDRIKAFYAR